MMKQAAWTLIAATILVFFQGSPVSIEGGAGAQPAGSSVLIDNLLAQAPDFEGEMPVETPDDAEAASSGRRPRYPLGYVASFGAFSLPAPRRDGHAMFHARDFNQRCCYCFYDGRMRFLEYSYDRNICEMAWKYKVELPDGDVRRFSFGSRNLHGHNHLVQRRIAVYGLHGNLLSLVRATYSESCH